MSATSVFSHVIPSQGLGHAALKGLGLFATWFLRGRARQQLRQLDELTLRDIGVTRYDAEIEANKPFWKE
ncbi:MAG: DUF1127 domain-containing protein [Alphaproteobacteria bacterium]